jgi:hypothetical protein
VARRANAGAIQHLLHALLVSERHRLLDVETGNAERFAQLRRQHHAGLPQALDAIERSPAQPAAQLAGDAGFIPQ